MWPIKGLNERCERFAFVVLSCGGGLVALQREGEKLLYLSVCMCSRRPLRAYVNRSIIFRACAFGSPALLDYLQRERNRPHSFLSLPER
jgi:hypothetical protein